MSLEARFSRREAPVREGGKTVRKDVEWVEIRGFSTGDVVSRRATDADRQRFKAAYQSFVAPLVAATAPVKAPATKTKAPAEWPDRAFGHPNSGGKRPKG